MRRQQEPELEAWLERLAWIMDRSIRIGPWSIGLDGLLGLIPGFGDATGGLISSVIVLSAIHAGIPRVTVLRMMSNVLIDSLLGALPFIGDFFDFAFRANTRNVAIFRDALLEERRISRDWGFLALIALVMFVLIAAPLVAAGFLLSRLISR